MCKLLVDHYTSSLKQNTHNPSTKNVTKIYTETDIIPRPSDYFGKRHSWLNKIPPFSPEEGIQRRCLYLAPNATTGKNTVSVRPNKTGSLVCRCAYCNASLLKLQSLMCSSCSTEALQGYMISLLDSDTDIKHSLYLLSTSTASLDTAVKLVVEQYPHILSEFTLCLADRVREVWAAVVNCLFSLIKDAVTDDDRRLVALLKSVLWLAVEKLDLARFLSLLPEQADTEFCLPFLIQAVNKHQAQQLCRTISELC